MKDVVIFLFVVIGGSWAITGMGLVPAYVAYFTDNYWFFYVFVGVNSALIIRALIIKYRQ